MRLALSILLASAFACVAQTNIVRVNFADFGHVILPNRQVTMQAVQTNLSSPFLISREPKKSTTDTNGVTYFTNIIAGAYDLTLASTPPTVYRIGVTNSGTNIMSAHDLVGIAASEANAVMGWTRSQADSRYVRGVAQGTNIITVTNSGVVTVHATGGGSGTTYTNNTDPVGVITGSGIGSNTTHLLSVVISTNPAYTNFLVSTGANVSTWNAYWIYTNRGAGWYYASNSTVTRLTNHGTWWGLIRTTPPLATNAYTNLTLTGTYQPNTVTNEPAPTFSYWLEGMLTTNYVYAGQTSSTPVFASDVAATVERLGGTNASLYVGIGFRGGSLGFPAYDMDERGFLMSSSDLMKWRVSTRPLLVGPAGHLRDCSLMQVGNFFGAAYTTNSATNASVAFGFALTTNFSSPSHFTNIVPALPGETVSLATHPEARVWGPVQVEEGTNIHVFVSYTSNLLNTPFHLRKAVTPKSSYPNGLTNWTVVGNSTAYTNLIEIAAVYSGGNWNAFVTGPANQVNGDGNKLRHMRFSDSSLTNLVLVFADVLGSWGNNVEGIWALPAPDGRIALGLNYYLGLADGVIGDGHVYRVSYGNANLDAFTTPAMVDFSGFYVQNFKPLRLTQPTHVANASAAVSANSAPAGDFYVPSRYGQSGPTNTTFFGLNDRTNDTARIALGTETWPLLGFGYSTSRIGQFFIGLQNASGQGNEFYDHGATNFMSVFSNWMSFNLPIRGVVDSTNLAASLAGKVDKLNGNLTNATHHGGFTVTNTGQIMIYGADPSDVITMAAGDIILNNGTFIGAHSGDGSMLTGIPATSLTGTIPLANLPTFLTNFVQTGICGNNYYLTTTNYFTNGCNFVIPQTGRWKLDWGAGNIRVVGAASTFFTNRLELVISNASPTVIASTMASRVAGSLSSVSIDVPGPAHGSIITNLTTGDVITLRGSLIGSGLSGSFLSPESFIVGTLISP